MKNYNPKNPIPNNNYIYWIALSAILFFVVIGTISLLY